MNCSQCGYNMEPLDTVCRKCKGQGVANANAAAPQPATNPWQMQPPPGQNPYGQAPPLSESSAYQRPDYVPQAPQKQGGFSLNANVLIGGAACLFGIIATAIGYFNAAPGKSYTLFWGAIVFGGYRFFRGVTED